ncbi:MAG: right-handed parallel beta-helix repeat-containing protein [Rudaea sp.]
MLGKFAWVQVAAVIFMIAATAVQATTFTVTNTYDSGAGSLRQALLDANAMQVTDGMACAPHTIQFAIAGAGVHTIQPISPLPPLQIPVTLDGYSQPGTSMNTLSEGDNAKLAIELDGSLAGMSDGLAIAPHGSLVCGGSSSLIRGLVINRFAGAAIAAVGDFCPLSGGCGSGNVSIYGNFLGTDASGMLARGNGTGVVFGQNTTQNVVGDQIYGYGGSQYAVEQTRNIISGNVLDGIYLASTNPDAITSLNHHIRNNYIGVDATGTVALPNGRNGVFADAGSTATVVEENLISGNLGDGVVVADNIAGIGSVRNNGIGVGVGNVALGNLGNGVRVSGASRGLTVGGQYPLSIFFDQPSIANNAGAGVMIEDSALVDAGGGIANNAGLAIDLAPGGANPNDDQDADIGANELLNHPLISAAIPDPVTGGGRILGTLNSNPGITVEIRFYLSDACDPSGIGGGQHPLRNGQFPISTSVTTDAQGNASFDLQVANLPSGGFLTALTRRATLIPGVVAFIVSEFSPCRLIDADWIFSDDFEV